MRHKNVAKGKFSNSGVFSNVGYTHSRSLRNSKSMPSASKSGSSIYIGPAPDGTNQEYNRVISGHVNYKKPSFA